MSESNPRRPHPLVAALVLIALGMTSCSYANRRAGAANMWRSGTTQDFEIGTTTLQQVLNQLGPPSQLIQLGDRTALYYMLESTRTRAVTLVVYSHTETNVDYDRAVFFFDKDLVLEHRSLSFEALPFEDPRQR